MALNQKVAVVTGGASGIGRVTSMRLAEDGIGIAIWDMDAEGARETAGLIADKGGRACACEVDIAVPDQVAGAIERTRADLGPATILINNASHFGSARFEELSVEEWDRMIDVDLKGPFLCAKAMLSDMLAAEWGRIINITSSALYLGTPYMAHYVAAKGGLAGLTRALAMEFAARGITVNNVPAGYIEGPRLRRNQASFTASAGKAENTALAFPMKRAGKPEEVAEAIAYLVSDLAAYVTGQTLGVHGGRYLP